jgi:phospholipase C
MDLIPPFDRTFGRRTFLRGAALTGAGLAAGGLLPGGLPSWVRAVTSTPNPPGTLPFPNRPAGMPAPDLAPELNPIEHIVMVMMENHSFDNYLGMLPYQVASRAGQVAGWPQLGPDGRPTTVQVGADGHGYRAFFMPNACQISGAPSQSWTASHTAFDGGAMDGFARASGEVAMGCWDHRVLPFLYSLAGTFPVLDHYFCSTLCQTYPNRVFAMAATAGGITSTDTPPPDVIPPNGRIFDVLEHYGISWGCYYTNLPSPGLLGKQWAAERQGTHLFGPGGTVDGTLALLQARILAGQLEHVVMVEEDFQWGSEENPQNVQAGEYFVSRVLQLLSSFPEVWKKTLLILNYDEHGGYYDHVVPPPALNPGDGTHPNLPTSQWLGDDYTRLGFRVPAVVVSPWAKPNFVSHTVFDHTSVLRTIEAKWNLPALTYRDANANDLRECLVRSGPPPLLYARWTPAPSSTPFGTAVLDSEFCAEDPGAAGRFPPPVS